MKRSIIQLFIETFPQIIVGEELAGYTTFKIGGKGTLFLVVKDQETMRKAYTMAKDNHIPIFVLGGGSNVLVASSGFDGLVLKNEMRGITVEGSTITAESGVILATVIKEAKNNGLVGIAPLQGVPGTFGAAVRGNVGVPNCEIGDKVVSATLLCADGSIKQVDRTYFGYEYRYSVLKDNTEVLLEATIELAPGGVPEEIQQEMMETLKMRKAKQPWGKSGGSFFKNPSKEYAAGFLVDQVGGKGSHVGDAVISEKHANFFTNQGKASSSDMLRLARRVRHRVLAKFGIMLEREVEYIGKPPMSDHITKHPVLRWITVGVLLLLSVIGGLLPVMPGFIFFILAVYIVSPSSVAKVMYWFRNKK